MSEESDPSPKQEDLESLLGGLDFTPNWAKEEPGVKEPPRQGRSGGRGGRSGGPRGPRDSSRRNLQGVRVKPRRDHSPHGGHGGGHGGGRDSGRGRPDRDSGPRGSYPPRAPRVPVHVDFIPEKKRLSLVVRVIRQSHKVFPLQVVAGKFMENPAFISMKYTVKDKGRDTEPFQLYVCRANGMVFTDEKACERYVIDHGIEANYESASQEVAPPSGNFVCIGRHRPSGRLIGPPNWHGYQARLAEVRAEVAESLPPEHFLADIEMVHDADVIEAWKKEVSTQTFYREKLEEPKDAEPDTSDSADASDGSEDAAQQVQEVSEPPEGSDSTASDPADTTEPAPTEDPDVSEPTGSEPTESSDPPAAEDDRPYNMTREQVEADFCAKYLKRLVGRTQRAILPGYLYPRMTDPSLQSLTDYHLRREHDRPNSIIFALRPAFKHMRLQVYRYNGELVVSGIAQHPLPEDLKIAPEIRSILEYVETHPGCNTQEALKAVSNSVDEVPAETVSHFRWLIEKGHLLEFHDDTLQLPHRTPKGGGGSRKPKKSPAEKSSPASESVAKPAAETPEAKAPEPKTPEPKAPEPKAPEPKASENPPAAEAEPETTSKPEPPADT